MPRVRRCRQPGCHELVSADHYYCPAHRQHEAEYLASRQKWARSRDEGYRHRYDQVTRNRSEAKTEQYKFYKSKAWAGLRAQVLARDDHIDQYLKLLGIYEVADTVDHIVPIEFEPDQMQNPDNLISCGRHTHLIKTRWEKKYYFDRGGQPKSVEPIREIGKILPILAPLGLDLRGAHT